MALIVVQRSMAVLLCLAIREVGGVSSTGVGRQSHPPAGKLENSRFLRQGVMTHGAKQMVEDESHINSHTISRASVVDLGLGGEPSYGKIPGVENMVLSMLKQRRTPTMDSFVHTVEALIGDMTEQLLKDHNVSQAYIDLVAGNVSTCSSSASFSSFEKSYADTLPLHRPCREAESGLKAVYDACVARVAADCDSKTAWCAAYDTLNVEPNKEECTANAENREAWLRRLQTEFTTKYDTLISKKTKCENYTILCQQPCDGTALSAKTAECDGFLNTIESSACQWASGMKSLRDGSQSCYDGKKQAYEDAEAATQILEADRKVQYRALQRLLCLLGALGNATAGQAPDAAVIDSCKAATHTGDVLTISYPLLPGYTTPPAPTKYPCTSAYEADVYTDLPSSVTVRACASSTACPAMTPTTTTTTTPGCEPVNMNDLQLDLPSPPSGSSTDITVNGEILTVTGSGMLDQWGTRNGAPLAWMHAPQSDIYTFEVDCRLVKGSDQLNSIMTVYDGPDGSQEIPFNFGPRTWGGQGVGVQKIMTTLYDDYTQRPNPGRGEDPFLWHRLRIVRRPHPTGASFDVAYRVVGGGDWVEVRKGLIPDYWKVKGTRIALGLKQKKGDGEVEFRNLVVHAGEPKCS